MIPRIVHQIWFGPEMPNECVHYTERIRDIFERRSWKYNLWTLDDIHVTDGEATRLGDVVLATKARICRAPTYCEMSDIARFEVLYAQGGVYLDCDVEVTGCFHDLIENMLGSCGVIGHKEDRVSTFWMYCHQYEPFFGGCLEDMRQATPDELRIYDSNYCGPQMLQRRRDAAPLGEQPYRIPSKTCPSKEYGRIGCHHNRSDWRDNKVIRHEWSADRNDESPMRRKGTPKPILLEEQ